VIKFQPQSDHLVAKGGEVVLVGFANLVDQAVKAEPFQQSGDLAVGFIPQSPTQMFTLEAADAELPSSQGSNSFWS